MDIMLTMKLIQYITQDDQVAHKHTYRDKDEIDHNNQVTTPNWLCEMTIWTLNEKNRHE